jgi:lysozyme
MKKPLPRKPAPRRKSKKKKSFFSGKILSYSLVTLFILILFGLGYHYRNGLAYYFSFKTDKILREEEDKRLADIRIYQVLRKHSDQVYGFDVSEYQGKIDWKQANSIEDTFPLKFVFIRATAGKDKIDTKFKENWRESKKQKFIRGAYHYYRPNENSIEQANNFIKNVKLQKGDLPPVLDIEKLPREQSLDSLKVGLRRWLKRVEAHYNVKPIIYSGESYYSDFLEDEFSEYTFWIANYNFFVENIKDDWTFWQFTEKATVPGVKGFVDVNIYNGTPKQLGYFVIN